jgi:anti-anti-sigma factor
MAIHSNVSSDGKQLTIVIEDRFDFSLHQQFRDAYCRNNTSDVIYTLDLSKTEYMDSSALGMILLLKDHVQLYSGKLVISKPNDTVNKILEIAQFHRLMTIEL